MSEDYINKVMDSIDHCLSISPNSCDECKYRDISHPKCKINLINDLIEIVNYYREKERKANED